ncbi:carbohydrate kinase [Salipaludibacillus sp. CF4.18]|uniref:carbohydrate kinase n=1 Tax=Salipaludibacillus sp. CF4.18 TaxID=3373081 RepID=UPI003EE4C27C
MNEKEEYIIGLIKNNPYISQQDLASRLQLSRSAVAGYISSLTKNGHIKGRAYVLNNERQVLCVGGANIDRKAKIQSEFQWEDSNPVVVSETIGGVARNIADNLARLQVPTLLYTAVGSDSEGDKIWSHSSHYDMSTSIQKQDQRTGNYTAVLNEKNNMMFALAEMDIYDAVSVADVKKSLSHFRSADMIILDTNFPKDVLSSIFHQKDAGKQILGVVPVSAKKINRLPDDLSKIDYFILNIEELNAVIERYVPHVKSKDIPMKMDEIVKLGVKNIIVTAGEKGAHFQSVEGSIGQTVALKTHVEDVTGAGDAFAAGVFYSIHKGLTLKVACENGTKLAQRTLSTTETVAEGLNESIFNEVL